MNKKEITSTIRETIKAIRSCKEVSKENRKLVFSKLDTIRGEYPDGHFSENASKRIDHCLDIINFIDYSEKVEIASCLTVLGIYGLMALHKISKDASGKDIIAGMVLKYLESKARYKNHLSFCKLLLQRSLTSDRPVVDICMEKAKELGLEKCEFVAKMFKEEKGEAHE